MKNLPNYQGQPLPRDLSTMTQKQIDDVMDYLTSLSLKELRRRQELLRSQQRLAPSRSERLHPYQVIGLNNLDVWETLYIHAIDRVAFPDDEEDDE